MASQFSTSTTSSSIPPDLVENQDDVFICEIEHVDEIYFGNVEHTEIEPLTDEFADSLGINFDEEDETDNTASGTAENDHDIRYFDEIESRSEDKCEIEKREKFFRDTCGCEKLYSKPCSKVVNSAVVIDFRETCLETDRDELDIMVKVQLYAHRKNDSTVDTKKHKSKIRERLHQQYFFNGQEVCRNTFMFAHAIGKSRLESISKSLQTDGFKPRMHGNKGKLPKHAMTITDIERVKHFLSQYASQFGVHLPGRLPNYKDTKVILLPSDKTKADIHQEYEIAAREASYRNISLSEFKKLWLDHCPHIVLMKPATDLCSTCQNYSVSLGKGGNLTEEQKCETLKSYENHLKNAGTQRDDYRNDCKESKINFESLSEDKKLRGQEPLSYNGTMHYSFDYAQQIYYPHYSQQVGPLFFKTPRKCNCFGICAEGSGTQILYLVDEEESVGKGANSVVSMLHHHFEYKGYGETCAKLHMDNCSGQNKNNTVIWYGLWRVMTGRHEKVQYSCMEAGHTKFHPDWHFGLWKIKWRSSNAETLTDIASSVSLSSRNHHNIPQLVNDPDSPVLFYDWKKYLKTFFKPVPDLLKYHHFRLDKDVPGSVFLRKYATDEEIEVNVLKKRSPNLVNMYELMPTELHAKGLDAGRQWYLYQEIRPYCYHNKDVACPKPLVPKPEIKIKNDSPQKTE